MVKSVCQKDQRPRQGPEHGDKRMSSRRFRTSQLAVELSPAPHHPCCSQSLFLYPYSGLVPPPPLRGSAWPTHSRCLGIPVWGLLLRSAPMGISSNAYSTPGGPPTASSSKPLRDIPETFIQGYLHRTPKSPRERLWSLEIPKQVLEYAATSPQTLSPSNPAQIPNSQRAPWATEKTGKWLPGDTHPSEILKVSHRCLKKPLHPSLPPPRKP